MRVFTVYMFIFIVSFLLYVGIRIFYYAGISNMVNSDAAVVLGAGINHDQPTPVFRERINHGVTLYKARVVKKLIFTGGKAKGMAFAESEVAQRYAIKEGVNPDDIFIEKASTITYENIIEAKKILNSANINSVLIVSDPLHMKRAMIMAKDLGVNAKTAPTPTSMYKSWSSKFSFLLREVCFYVIYIFQRPFL